jgi:hypothetical protein
MGIAEDWMEAALTATTTPNKKTAISSLTLAAQTSFWLLCVDLYPAIVAACIPWSTTAVAIFMVLWFIVIPARS